MGEAIYRIEEKIGHRVVWLICLLHTNELPLRHLFTNLDEKTCGKDSFSGSMGKLCRTVASLPATKFGKIDELGCEGIREIPKDIFHDLSADQFYLYQTVRSISSGKILPSIEKTKPGPLNHTRWLTLANRVCRIYISKHGLKGTDKENLKTICQFIVTDYVPMWFHIKCSLSYIHGPRHVFRQMQLLKSLEPNVQDACYIHVYIETLIRHTLKMS